MIRTLKRFFAFCTEENRKKFERSLMLGVILAMMQALKFPAIYLVIQGFLTNTITNATIWTGFFILLCSCGIGAAARARSAMLQCEAGYGECADKRINIAEHLRYLPMGYFNENSLGEIASVTTNIMEQLGDVATRVVMMTTQGLLDTAIIVLLILITDWRIGLISLAGITLFALCNHRMQCANEKLSQRKIAVDTRLVADVLEYIQGIPEVKAYNLIGDARKKLDNAIHDAAQTNTALEMQANRFVPVQGIIIKLTGVAILLAVIGFYLNGTMELLTAILMMIMSFQVFSGLETMGQYSALLRMVDLCVGRGQAILSLPPMDIHGSDPELKTRDIAVDDIEFSYDQKKIIDGVSLSVREKTTAAFVGPSGGGKTTLCHLIARFWDVQAGKITLDQQDVRRYSMDALMRNYSFVFQHVFLFHDTVANNIRFGRPDAPMEEVIAAAKKACCHDFIMALPDGYETVIGENGASLSGGEKQRISIARAIMKDAPIIILDEATANIDPENEQELMEAIAALTREKTILMIAHRLKTVENADRIFVVDQGKIVQQGNHDALMQEDGIYRRFVDSRKQAIGWKVQNKTDA